MVRGKDIAPEKKIAVKTLLESGKYSQREIATKIGVSQPTVARIAKTVKEGRTLELKRPSRIGLNRATTPRDERQIRAVAEKTRKKPLRVVGKEVRSLGINISDRTLRRRLLDLGFKCRRPAKKPLLTDRMKKLRLAWAKNHRFMTENDWAQVSFLNLYQILYFNIY